MRRRTRYELAVASYVMLFIIAPLGLLLYKFSAGRAGVMLLLVVAWLFVVIEFVDSWLRLWGLKEGEDRKPRRNPKLRTRRREPFDPDMERRRFRKQPPTTKP